jgi:hypothetical protein
MNINTEDLIEKCVLGGQSCDPQVVADNIREYSKENKCEFQLRHEKLRATLDRIAYCQQDCSDKDVFYFVREMAKLALDVDDEISNKKD